MFQVQNYDQIGSAWLRKDCVNSRKEMFKRKRGITMCYSCRTDGHLARDCPKIDPTFVYCKAHGHIVEDCPKMIAKVEERDKLI